MDKRGKKGEEINYSSLEMSEYILPINNHITTEEKCEIFAMKNRMIQIPNNFKNNDNQSKCPCGCIEDMKHIYECEILNENEKPNIQYEKIFNGNIKQQIEVYRKFKQNMEKREKLMEIEPPCDLSRSAVFSVMD